MPSAVYSPQRSHNQSSLISPQRTQSTGQSQTLAKESPIAGLSTPSTAADSLVSSSSCSILCRDANNMKKSLALATTLPEERYMQRAGQILQEGLSSQLMEQRFLEAMTRQGVQLCDFEPNAKVSHSRKVALLAAVLQEMDGYDDDAAYALLPAEILRLQLQAKREESIERIQCRRATIAGVARNKQGLAEERRDLLERRSASEQARSARMRRRHGQLDNERRMRASSREAHWQDIVDTGAHRLDERIKERRASLEHQDARFQLYLQVRQEDANRHQALSEEKEKARQDTFSYASELHAERIATRRASLGSQEDRLKNNLLKLQDSRDRARERLQDRFVLVEDGVARAHEDAAASSQHFREVLEEKSRRSSAHQLELRLQAEDLQQVKDEKRQDREHQRDRIARIREHQRLQRHNSVTEDSAVFNKCRRFQVATSYELLHLTTDEGSSIGAVDLVEE